CFGNGIYWMLAAQEHSGCNKILYFNCLLSTISHCSTSTTQCIESRPTLTNLK
ncbi:hypothetical protein K1T71_001099, partial [Dendrolimus kikuchii]